MSKRQPLRTAERSPGLRPGGLGASGDGFTRSIEWAVTLMIFTGIGWLVDRWTHTLPVFMIIGFVLGAIGLFTRAYYSYRHDMSVLEQNAPWGTASKRTLG